MWAQNYGYPVVAMYAWVPEGLQKIEMTSVAKETMTYLLQQAEGKISYWDTIFEGNPRFQPKEATLVYVIIVWINMVVTTGRYIDMTGWFSFHMYLFIRLCVHETASIVKVTDKFFLSVQHCMSASISTVSTLCLQ